MNREFKVYDAILVGSGQGVNPLAMAMAKAGWQIAVVEKENVGGSCINNACTPTKTMIASARVAHIVNKAKDYGINATLESVDLTKVLNRKNAVVESFRGGLRKRFLSTPGITLLEGEAHFIGKKQLEVNLTNGDKLPIQSELIVINTGARPAIPSIPGLDTVNYLTSTTLMEINEMPKHLLIIGGGHVGLEFGQMFHRFGSKVTIIQVDPQLLPHEDEDVAEEIISILKQEGLEILLNTKTLKIEPSENNKIKLTIKNELGEQTMEGSHLLVATGRAPNTDALNLESTGIKLDKHGYIPVNPSLETEVPGIFAIGDVNGEPKFSHISYDDFRILNSNILHKGNATTTGRQLPYTVFIDPQLGRIGITEKTARAKGLDYQVAKIPLTGVPRAIETGETIGMMKAVVDSKTGQILGAAILGLEGGEVMAMIQLSMLGGLTYKVLRDAIFSHPSISEALNILFDGIKE